MEVGKRYLVKRPKNTDIKEWECLEVSETAVKVKNNVKSESGFLSFSNTTDPFWVLKTEIDTIGQTTYHILEELKN